MSVDWDDVSDIRFNPFTGEETPVFISNEEQTIPNSSPYLVKLNESPVLSLPSTVSAKIKETGQELKEVAKSKVPAKNEFAVNYDEKANGEVLVNSFYKGKTLQVSYQGLGSNINKNLLQSLAFTGDRIWDGKQTFNDDLTINADVEITGDTQLNNITNQGLIVLEYRVSPASFGGTATAGAWYTRPLNTEVIDTGNFCTLSSNQFTLEAGTYTVDAIGSFFSTSDSFIRIYNVTDVVSVAQSPHSAAGELSVPLSGAFTIASAKVFELQYLCQTSQAGSGLGVAPGGTAQPAMSYNCFATVKLHKII